MLIFCKLTLCYIYYSYTFEKVQENSGKHWHYQFYTVLSEYKWRIPSPINILIRPFFLIFDIQKGKWEQIFKKYRIINHYTDDSYNDHFNFDFSHHYSFAVYLWRHLSDTIPAILQSQKKRNKRNEHIGIFLTLFWIWKVYIIT